MQPSTESMNKWGAAKCECGGHGGGHFAGCSKRNPYAVALGSIKSEKKANSSRLNGKKGGRPKKSITNEDNLK